MLEIWRVSWYIKMRAGQEIAAASVERPQVRKVRAS